MSTTVKEFWEEQARKCGEDVTAVNFDVLSDDFAGIVFDEIVADGMTVADVGCGNGRNIIELAAKRPNGRFFGYDFAETMISVAEARRERLGLSNVKFAVFDATSPRPPEGTEGAFDLVIGKRLLINIKGPAKGRVLRNVHAMLKDGGAYVMSECFVEPLARVNEIRSRLGLERIEIKSFNEYLSQAFMQDVGVWFTVERQVDIDSLYYFISRVFNAYLSNGNPDYMAPINKLAAKLVEMGVRPMQGFSPEYAHVLRKRDVPSAGVGEA